jgi:hypothetical protein
MQMKYSEYDDDMNAVSILLNKLDHRLELEGASPKVWTKAQVDDLRNLWSLCAMLKAALEDLDPRRP